MSEIIDRPWALVRQDGKAMVYALAANQREVWEEGVRRFYGVTSTGLSFAAHKKLLRSQGYRARRVHVCLP